MQGYSAQYADIAWALVHMMYIVYHAASDSCMRTIVFLCMCLPGIWAYESARTTDVRQSDRHDHSYECKTCPPKLRPHPCTEMVMQNGIFWDLASSMKRYFNWVLGETYCLLVDAAELVDSAIAVCLAFDAEALEVAGSRIHDCILVYETDIYCSCAAWHIQDHGCMHASWGDDGTMAGLRRDTWNTQGSCCMSVPKSSFACGCGCEQSAPGKNPCVFFMLSRRRNTQIGIVWYGTHVPVVDPSHILPVDRTDAGGPVWAVGQLPEKGENHIRCRRYSPTSSHPATNTKMHAQAPTEKNRTQTSDHGYSLLTLLHSFPCWERTGPMKQSTSSTCVQPIIAESPLRSRAVLCKLLSSSKTLPYRRLTGGLLLVKMVLLILLIQIWSLFSLAKYFVPVTVKFNASLIFLPRK